MVGNNMLYKMKLSTCYASLSQWRFSFKICYNKMSSKFNWPHINLKGTFFRISNFFLRREAMRNFRKWYKIVQIIIIIIILITIYCKYCIAMVTYQRDHHHHVLASLTFLCSMKRRAHQRRIYVIFTS